MEFAQYTNVVKEFVAHHQNWAFLVVFLLAFGESLAFISLILPFWAMLVAIGAIIGGTDSWNFWLIVTAGAFWVVRMDMVQDLFTGMYRAGQYPVTVYPLGLKLVLTYLVPIGFAVTVPAESLTGRLTWQRLVATALFLVVVMAITRLIWRAGTSHYSGASA